MPYVAFLIDYIVEPIRNYEKSHYVVNTIEPYYSSLIPFAYVPINPCKK